MRVAMVAASYRTSTFFESSDIGVVQDLPEAAGPRNDVVTLVQAALLVDPRPEGCLEDVRRRHAAVEADAVDHRVGVILLHAADVFGGDDEVHGHDLQRH